MRADEIRLSIESEGEFTFTRSSGPGGQNVNKVNSRTQLRVSVDKISGITELERHRLLLKLGKPEILVAAQDERSQLLNRELAVERAANIVIQLLHVPKKRTKTKPTRASKERRLLAKRSTSTHKANRTRPKED